MIYLRNNLIKGIIISFFLWINFTFVEAQNNAAIIEKKLIEIDLLKKKKDYSSILNLYEEIIPITEDEGLKSEFFKQLGITHSRLKNYEQSIVRFNQALGNALIHTPSDTSFISDQYYYLANTYYKLKDFNQALDYNKKTLSTISIEDDIIGSTQTLVAIANIYYMKSDYDNAILFGQQALHVIEKEKENILEENASPDEIKSLIANCNIHLALYHYFKHDYKIALPFASSAITFFDDMSINLAPRKRITAFNNYAIILIQLGEFSKARTYLDKATAIEENRTTEFNKAFLHFKTQSWQKANDGFNKAIAVYQEKYPNGHRDIAKSYYYIGNIKEEEKKEQAALQAYQKSLESLVPDFVNDNVLHNPNLNEYCYSQMGLLRALIAKAAILGKIFIQENQSDSKTISSIFETYDLAIEVAETLRQNYKAEGSRYFLAEETKGLFEEAVAFSYQLYQKTGKEEYLEKAFFYVEKNQMPILLQNHLALEGQTVGGVPQELIEEEKQLLIDFAFSKNQRALAKTKGDKKAAELYADYMFSYKQKLDLLREDFKVSYPRYFEHQHNSNTLSIKDVRKSLSDEQLFLQYYLTGNRIYVFSISKESAELIQIEDAESVKEIKTSLLTSIQNPLTKADPEAVAYQKFVNSSHELYKSLIRPSIEKQAEKPKRLTIASNGFLMEIPFEVLLSELPKKKESTNYLRLSYLINDFAISYQPSASLMVRLKQTKNNQAKEELLAMAPFSKEGSYAGSFTRQELGDLPYTRNEVENLEELFNVYALYEANASKERFLELSSDFRILHMATHGIADFENGGNAQLLFYSENSPNPRDYSLYNYEVQNLQLNADLVVLSACETGAGKIDRGEGILSLARGFFYTGVPSVIMSKWQINDRSSSLIINDLYQNIKLGEDKDVALQNAKINYLQKKADTATGHPFYWSGLVQLGNSDALEFGEKRNWKFLALIPVALLLLLLLIKKTTR